MSLHDRWKHNRGSLKGKMRPESERRGMRWRVCYEDATGTTREKSFDNKEEAIAFDARKKDEAARGTFIDERGGKMTLTTYAEQWLAALTLRPNTIEGYTRVLKLHILPILGKLQVRAVTRTHILGWVKAEVEEKGLAASTVHMHYAILATLFKAAVFDGLRGTTPCVKIALPDRSRKTIWLPTPLQVAALIKHMEARFQLAVYIGAGCGLRWSEIMGLSTGDLDLKAGVIHVRRQLVRERRRAPYLGHPKTRSSVRDVDMPADVVEAVTAHLAAGHGLSMTIADHTALRKAGDPPREITAHMLFANQAGRFLWRTDWTDKWRNAIAAAGKVLADAPIGGRDGFVGHSLRHFFVSLLIESGASVIEVQHAVGHADPTTTLNTYSHLWPERKPRKAVIEAAFERGRAELDGLNEEDEAA